MDDDGLAIRREVDVELQRVDAERDRAAKRRQAVFRPQPGAAAVGGDLHRLTATGAGAQEERGQDEDAAAPGSTHASACSRATRSARSLMIMPTPSPASRRIVASSLTVKTPTPMPAARAAFTTAASQSV